MKATEAILAGVFAGGGSGGGGGGGKMVVTIDGYYDEDLDGIVCSADKTVEEIVEAVEAGIEPIARLTPGLEELTSQGYPLRLVAAYKSLSEDESGYYYWAEFNNIQTSINGSINNFLITAVQFDKGPDYDETITVGTGSFNA